MRVAVVGPAGADDLVAHRIDRADIIDHPAPERDRQFLALGEHVLDALVRGVAAGEHLAVEQQPVARLPRRHHIGRQRIEIDADRFLARRPFDLGPVIEVGRLQKRRAGAVEMEMRVAGGGAVRDHRHRLGGGVGRVIEDFDVEDGREPAQPLRADAERVDLVENLDAQLLDVGLRAARLQLRHVDVAHQRFPWPSSSPSRRCRRCRCRACRAGTSRRPSAAASPAPSRRCCRWG